MPPRFMIIDGNNLIHRAFHALPLFHTADGLYTNAIYGFTNMLIKILGDFKPEYLAVAFDKGRVTFRTEIYKDYKASRKTTEPELSQQIPLVEELLSAWGIKMFKVQGYEGDDIIGTLASLASSSDYNLETLIVTSDRDILQLVNAKVKVLLTHKGISEISVMDEKAIREKYAVDPQQIVDLKALMGDKSDNIPGVPGIGEKTAVKLLQEFGSIENILKNIDCLPGKKTQALLRENSGQALLSQKLAAIVTDMPLEFSPCEFLFKPDKEAVKKLFQRLEFKSLLDKLNHIFKEIYSNDAPAKSNQGKNNNPENYPNLSPKIVETILDADSAEKIYLTAKETKKISCFPVVSGILPLVSFEAIAFTAHDKTSYIPADSPAWQGTLAVLADDGIEKITHDAKLLWNACQNQNVTLKNLSFDTMLAAYLLDPTALEYPLHGLANLFGDITAVCDSALITPEDYAGQASDIISALEPILKKRLEDAGLYNLFNEVEMPLIEVLSSMECHGVKIDKKYLQKMAGEIGLKLNDIISQIYNLSGEHFNINSTKQLAFILFEKLKLPPTKKTKTGYSTDIEVLEKLTDAHPIVGLLLEYRTLSKLKSTYLDALEPLIRKETGRIHTTFNQMVTVTGRLSSSEPNLQNIPVRTDIGRKIREFFVTGDEFSSLMSADYSQIELRILAHLSGDEKLVEAFNQNQDVHARTAAEVFGVSVNEVTSSMRAKAKAVNFGIVYGISDYGLARDIGVSRQEAALYIDNYFAKYQGVKKYIDDGINTARKCGYVTTLFGRRRFLPDINSSNFNRRSFAERTAMNTPIQGAAADIIKMAMIKVYCSLKESGLKSRLLLQVHDELVLEVFPGEEEKTEKIVQEAMEKIVTLKIPLVVGVAWGKNWASAK